LFRAAPTANRLRHPSPRAILALPVKSLANSRDKDEIRRRVRSVRQNSSRQWGKMSAHQMICHLSDGFRLYMGEVRARPAKTPLPAAILKTVALWAPLKWPTGFKTAPEIDQEIDGTPPAIFEGDVADLEDLIARFTRKPQDFTWPLHPHFGFLTEKEWMRLAYLHCDHHLRQFSA
jgi:hypothetical protein